MLRSVDPVAQRELVFPSFAHHEEKYTADSSDSLSKGLSVLGIMIMSA